MNRDDWGPLAWNIAPLDQPCCSQTARHAPCSATPLRGSLLDSGSSYWQAAREALLRSAVPALSWARWSRKVASTLTNGKKLDPRPGDCRACVMLMTAARWRF